MFDTVLSENPRTPKRKLNVGDVVGKIVLGELITARITKVEGNDKYLFYRTDSGICYRSDSRTDIEVMRQEAEEARKRYHTIEINPADVDKLLHFVYAPRKCDGRVLDAFIGIYDGMLLWEQDTTFQFLEPVDRIEKEYKKKLKEIMCDPFGKPRQCEQVSEYPVIKRLYRCHSHHGGKEIYAEAEYAVNNGVVWADR